MTKRLSLVLLCSAAGLFAQSAPAPELALDVNSQSEAVVANGWPLLIRVMAVSADGQPLSVALNAGAWTQALHLTITDQNGAVRNWPVQLVAPASNSLSLSGTGVGQAIWLVAPSDTSAIPAGLYGLSVTLDTSSGAATGSWSGSVKSSNGTVQLQAEASTLTSEDEASKYLAFAAYSRLRGDTAGAKSALDTLMAHQPEILEAYTEKADLLAAGGDYAGALALDQQALDKFNARTPVPTEAPVVLHLQVMSMADKLARQQRQGTGNTVTSVLPGSGATVLTPESIVSAYGSKLATSVANASGSLGTTLVGTTVTIADSTGASTLAPLFYVSPAQVNYEVPASVALGAATITVKSGDGTIGTGSVTITDVEPGLFLFNTSGLIAGSILRVTDSGQQVAENLFTQDGAGNITASPVDLSNGQVYLILYGTGIRRAAASQVTVSVGGVNAPVSYAGAQGGFVGLDQINVLLPASLAGRGDVPLSVTAAGRQSNTARITIK